MRRQGEGAQPQKETDASLLGVITSSFMQGLFFFK